MTPYYRFLLFITSKPYQSPSRRGPLFLDQTQHQTK